MAARRLVTAAAALAALASAGGAAAAPHETIADVTMPSVVLPASHVTVTARISPSGMSCILLMRFSDYTVQLGIPTRISRPGRTVWRFTVESPAPVGQGRLTVECGRLNAARPFSVAAPPVAHVNVAVAKKGFSQQGATVSYGAVLQVPALGEDARDVTVLVNVADAADRLLGSAQTAIAVIPAGGTYDLGGSLKLRAGDQAARLDLVVRARATVASPLDAPQTRNVTIVPSTADPQWVGEVDGELDNTRPDVTLTAARISVVLFDATGNVLGGGTTLSTLSLPPNTRGYFAVTGGVGAVPAAQAASAGVTVMPTYGG